MEVNEISILMLQVVDSRWTHHPIMKILWSHAIVNMQ